MEQPSYQGCGACTISADEPCPLIDLLAVIRLAHSPMDLRDVRPTWEFADHHKDTDIVHENYFPCTTLLNLGNSL